MKKYLLLLTGLSFLSCGDDEGSEPQNNSPTVEVSSQLLDADPFTYEFSATAEDADGDALIYSWDFGEGTTKEGAATETFSFEADQNFTVTVTVSDGIAENNATVQVSSHSVSMAYNREVSFQTIDGFGGSGPAIPFYFASNPGRYNLGDGYFDEAWLDLMVNDWGATIFRDAVSPAFEAFPGEFDADRESPRWQQDENNQNIPTTNYYFDGEDTPTGPQGTSLSTMTKYAAALKEKVEANGEEFKYILSVWTPPAWMKTNEDHMQGSLKEEYFDEFTNFLAEYIKTFESLSGVEVYALSLQNEPNLEHPEWTFGCSYTGESYRDLLVMVHEKFVADGIDHVKLYGPETVRFLSRMTTIMDPVFAHAEAHSFMDIMATHSYGGDGITIETGSADEWEELYNYSQSQGEKPLWMTETEVDGGWEGAMSAAKRMLSALKFGKVSAWLWWSVGAPAWETNTRNGFTLDGVPVDSRPKYYTSKNFYKFIRPGAVHIESSTDDESVGVVAFEHQENNITTLVAINDSGQSSVVKLNASELPDQFEIYKTADGTNCELVETINTSEKTWFIMSPNSVYTLQSVN